MEYTISTLMRALVTCGGAALIDLRHCMKGSTLWDIPIASALTFIMCDALVGDRNGEDVRNCTRERGAMDARGTRTLYGFGVAPSILGVTGGRWDNTAYMYYYRVTSTSLRYIHLGIISTEGGIWLSRMSLARVRTFPSSGVRLTKDGATNWVPQSTIMCGYGFSRHIRTGGPLPQRQHDYPLQSRLGGDVLLRLEEGEDVREKG